MSKQRRQRLNRNKRTRSRRSFIRIGVEQLENRILPGGFLDLLAGAAIASTFDLLPEQQLVPEEIESKSDTFTARARSANSLLQSGLSLPNFSPEPSEERVEQTQTEDDLGFTLEARATTSTLTAAAIADSFFASNQLVDRLPALPHSPSPSLSTPPLSTPARTFSSPISRLGAGVGAGSGQGYNMTGAELPQSNVNAPAKVAFAMPAWMMGEGESSGCGGGASGSGSMSPSASGVVTVSDAWASEDAGSITFTLSFSGTADCGFTVDYHTEDGTAVANSPTTFPWDYIGVASGDGSVAFSGMDGETVDVTIGITADSIVELDETFTLSLDSVHDGSGNPVEGEGAGITIGSGSGSASGSGDGSSATGTIANDDQAIVTIVGETNTGGPEGTGVDLPRVYGVHIDKEVDVDVVVNLSTIDGTATKADGDFGDVPASITIPQGLQSRLFDLTVDDDWKIELNETFQIKIDSVTASERNVIPTTTPFIDTIVNDDIGTIKLVAVDAATNVETAAARNEGDWGGVKFRAILEHSDFPSSGNVSVDVDLDLSLTTIDGLAQDNGYGPGSNDYNGGSGVTVTLDKGARYVDLPVTINDDNVAELNETFDIEIALPQTDGRAVGVGAGSITATINGDDYAKVSIVGAGAIEGDSGYEDIQFWLQVDKPLDRTVTVSTNDIGGNGAGGDHASVGSDYLVLDEGPFSLGGGAGMFKQIGVRIFGDTVDEQTEYFQIILGTLSDNGLAPFVSIDTSNDQALGTIWDND